ncbi:MAG: hypothetical protein HZC54_14520 [Verrucomicrobia bacterium]|nr:hypothetical protein [Verrucomicrobiota bacterium]
MKHSGDAIASFVVSLIIWLALVALILGDVVGMATPRAATWACLYFLLGVILHPIGFYLGIAGMLEKDRKHVFAVLGLFLNWVVLFGLFVLTCSAGYASAMPHPKF